jgi:indolepyruvate ferredoxin oxidoreductase beta subunit
MTSMIPHDPYNLIVTGVGGQGNVMTSRAIGNMLAVKDYYVTIGETFGASQRGGSVMSHLRISKKSHWSPQIPKGCAHMVLSMEPSETLKVLKDYGNPKVSVITNTRPTFPVGVISGNLKYPSTDEITNLIRDLSGKSWFFNATDKAMELGNPVLGNVIMAGALAGSDELPLDRDTFRDIMSLRFSGSKLEMNMKAYDAGYRFIAG